MAARAWLIFLLVLVLVPAGARADGKVLARGLARAETPEQRALLHWADGVETLVIETTVRAEATNFAWVIPLPAKPTEITPATPALFTTLQTIFQPAVEMRAQDRWAAFGLIAVLLWGLRGSRLGLTSRISILLGAALAMLLASLLLPSLGMAVARGAGSSASTVRLLGSERAGVFDVTTLTAARADDLVVWLQSRGFPAPAEMEPVVADYLKAGWVFIAAKADRDAATTNLTALHPLRFTFPAPEPVYPMRLTGAGGGSLRCDLYVFGPARAAAAGWRTVLADRTDPPDVTLTSRPRPGEIRLRHAELAALTQGAPWATKLSATLDAAAMRRDVEIRWSPGGETGKRVFTRAAAAIRGLNVAAALLAAGALVAAVRARRGPGPGRWFAPAHGLFALLCAAAGGLVFATLPKIPESAILISHGYPEHQIFRTGLSAAYGVHDELHKAAQQGRAPTNEMQWLALARRGAAERLRKEESGRLVTNVYTGDLVREEASPGNYTFERGAAGWEVVWHDFDGAPAGREPVPEPPTAARVRRP